MDQFKGTLMNDVWCSWTSFSKNVYKGLPLSSAYVVKHNERLFHKDLFTIPHPVVFSITDISHTTEKKSEGKAG